MGISKTEMTSWAATESDTKSQNANIENFLLALLICRPKSNSPTILNYMGGSEKFWFY